MASVPNYGQGAAPSMLAIQQPGSGIQTAAHIVLPDSKITQLPASGREANWTSAYDGIYAYSLRYPQFSLDLLTQQLGYQFIEDMIGMAACRVPLDLKRYAVLQDGWEVVPCYVDPTHPDHDKAKEIADHLRYALENICDFETDHVQDFLTVIWELMFGAWMGNKAIEIVWEYQKYGLNKGLRGFKGFYAKTNKQIAFDVNPDTLALKNFTSYTPATGYSFSIPVEKMLWYVHNQTNNEPAGVGDWRASYKHYYRLDGNLRFWAVALERWGAPVFIAQGPASSSSDMQAFQQALAQIRQGAPPYLPDNIKYQLVTAPQQVFIGFEQACRYDTEEISKVVIGNTLTTGAGDNSLALGQVHMLTGATYDGALSELMCNRIKLDVFRRFVRYNYGSQFLHLTPNLRLKKQLEADMLKMAQSLQILIETGNMPSRSAVIRDSMNLPSISPEEEKQLDAEKAALLEMQAQLANSRVSGKTAKMSEYEAEEAIRRGAWILYHTKYGPQAHAELQREKEIEDFVRDEQRLISA